MKKGLLLINVGTPDSPSVKDVRNYLKTFLNDPFVIEMPTLMRQLLVNGIIVPFRAPKSAKRYEQLWSNEGSPLLIHLLNLKDRLQEHMANDYQVFAAMNYGKPALNQVLEEIKKAELDKLVVFPLYPHFTKSTTLSAKHAVKTLTSHWRKCTIEYIDSFHNHPGFIAAQIAQATNYELKTYDHILFSYHSLPIKQVEAGCASAEASHCYKQACNETSALLAKSLHLSKEQYSSAFQSRFSKKWLAPYTSDVLKDLAQKNKKKVLIFTPSFVADCLETSVEIGIEYRDFFIQNGGKQLDLVPCVNASKPWVEGLIEIINKN